MPREIGNPPCYSSWRKLVKDRDNDKCRICGKKGNIARHIKSIKEYPELIVDLSNGITICKECDKEIHHLNARIRHFKRKNLQYILEI